MPTPEPTPGERALERIGDGAVRTLVGAFNGDIVRPGDDEYDDARSVWNGMIDKHPAVVARCTDTDDVALAITVAREHDLPLAVRGGGHNVAGTAVCDGGIVVDLGAITDVRVDPDARTVRAGGGATLGDVDRETQRYGMATPLGVVSQTGIAGLTLNGGVGHLRREHGLACDALRSADVVTADGDVLTASEDENADLFWALRGGGGNFGVVTAFEYQLYDVGPEIIALFAFHRGEHAVEALHRFREWAASASTEASVIPIYMHIPELEEYPAESWGDPALAFAGCHLGTADEAEAEFAPLREFGDPIVDHSGPMPYTDLQIAFDDEFPDGRRYYWKSTFLEELTDELVELIDRVGSASPSPLSTVDLWHLGGAIDDVERNATAFWHRGKPYMLTFEANWDDPNEDDANVAWVREGLAAARDLPGASGGYGNFPGFREDPARAVFGENYDRLAAVKARYDPENVFRRNQNVEPNRSGANA